MKVIQILPTISFGDAVSNDTIALGDALRSMGYATEIYAESIDPRLPKGTARSTKTLPVLKEEDIVLYHLSTGTPLNYQMSQTNGKLVVIYHNITPPEFLEPYDYFSARLCQYGLKGAKDLAKHAKYALADSQWNKQDLQKMGYTCEIDVLPILIAFADYEKEPNQRIIKKYQMPGTNILFTGRISPNKCQEDVIASFAAYKRYYDPQARLFLVGSYSGMEEYYHTLLEYVERLKVEDVYFTGHIPFDEILAYYRVADLFLCASEHEGFCVPLVEAMYFDIPIIAYDSTAIGWTLGGSGVLMSTKDPLLTAGMMHRVHTDHVLRETIVNNQRNRLQDFSHEKVKKLFTEIMKKLAK